MPVSLLCAWYVVCAPQDTMLHGTLLAYIDNEWQEACVITCRMRSKASSSQLAGSMEAGAEAGVCVSDTGGYQRRPARRFSCSKGR